MKYKKKPTESDAESLIASCRLSTERGRCTAKAIFHFTDHFQEDMIFPPWLEVPFPLGPAMQKIYFTHGTGRNKVYAKCHVTQEKSIFHAGHFVSVYPFFHPSSGCLSGSGPRWQ